MLYIAGGDHLPVKSLPSRQLIGPRPPVPPTPTANFFTLGRTMMQSALATILAGTSSLCSMAVNAVTAFDSVFSSSALLAPNAGRVNMVNNAPRSRYPIAYLAQAFITASLLLRTTIRGAHAF